MRKIRILFASLLFALVSLSGSATANATTTCPLFPTPSITTDTQGLQHIQSVNDYLLSFTAKYPSTPQVCITGADNYWITQNSKFFTTQTAAINSTFSKRMNSCMGGVNFSLWNVGSYLSGIKCLFQVSFIPSTQGLAANFDSVQTALKTHQPTSYVAVAVSSFTSLVNAWPTISNCTASSGSMDFSITVANGTPLDFRISCSPPSAMKPLRILEVTAVWLMLAFFIYRKATVFLAERQG
jgi:hypothetical protein